MARPQDAFTTYAILCGATPVRAIVDELYNRITNDGQLWESFSQPDLGRLKGHFRGFITAASGGPEFYTGRSMADAHAASPISPAHFDRVVDHLIEILTDLRIPTRVTAERGAQLASLKQEIAPVRNLA